MDALSLEQIAETSDSHHFQEICIKNLSAVCNSSTTDDLYPRTLTTQYSPVFGVERWRVALQINQTSPTDVNIGVYLAAINFTKPRPNIQYEITLLSMSGEKALRKRISNTAFDTISSKGTANFITAAELFEMNGVSPSDQFRLRCHIHEVDGICTPSMPRIMQTTGDYLTEPTDVAFVFHDGQKLFANKKILAAQSTYFAALFGTDFAEGQGNDVRMSEQADIADIAEDDSDNELEILEDCGVFRFKDINASAASADRSPNHVSVQNTLGNHQANRGQASHIYQVTVNDASFKTYKALLNWFYNKSVNFKIYDTELANLTSTKAVQDSAVSPRSLYRLADRLCVDELRALCLERFRETLTPKSALRYVHSPMVAQLAPLAQVLDTYLAEKASRIAALGKEVLGPLLTGTTSSEGSGGFLATLLANAAKSQ